MVKMKFTELCKRLENKNEEKWAYFKELNDPKFLEPFSKTNILNFNDQAAPQVIKYIERVLNNESKVIIIKIINKNLETNTEFTWGTYLALLDLIDKVDLVNKVEKEITNYRELFKNKNSIRFCENLLKNETILSTEKIYKDCISCLIKYEIKDTMPKYNKKEPQSIHDSYNLKKIIYHEPTKTIFEKLVARDEVFELLKTTYEKVIQETEDLSLFSRQFIKPSQEYDDYGNNDVRHIILDCFAISLKYSQEDNSEKIKELLYSEILMLQKTGLYAISLNYQKYKNIFFEFLRNLINKENKINIINDCRYEIITIFEILSKPKDELINSDPVDNQSIDTEIEYIEEFLKSFNEEDNRLKYRLMHGLKNHSSFNSEFNLLKTKNFDGQEDIFAKLSFISQGGMKEVVDESPIEITEFRLKNIEEQINYLLGSKNRFHREERNGKYIEKNDSGLAEMFKEILLEDYENYIASVEIKRITNPKIIGAIFDAMKERLVNKEGLDIEKILEIMEFFFKKVGLSEDCGDCYHSLNNLVSKVIKKSDKQDQFNSLYKIIKKINELNQNETASNDLGSDAINHCSGRNWENFIKLILKEQILPIEQKDFLDNQLSKKDINYSDKLFLYHFGYYFYYLASNIKKVEFYKNIEHFTLEQRKLFLTGVSMGGASLDVLEKIKAIILNAFLNNEFDNDNIERNRFVSMIAIAKFKFNKDDLFKEFETYLKDNGDKRSIVSLLTRKDMITKLDKNKVFEYWKELIKDNFSYPEELLNIFVKYKQENDFITYKKEINKILELYSTLKERLNSDYIFVEFLKEFLKDIKKTGVDKTNSVQIYNMIYYAIEASSKYNYLSNISELFKEILLVLRQQDKEGANTLAQKICKTSGLIQYSNLFSEFCTR